MHDAVVIAPGEPIPAGTSRSFQVSSPRAPGQRTVLLLEIRMDSPTPGGCNYGMSIRFNDRSLGTALDWMRSRLLGKAPIAHVRNHPGAQGPWVRNNEWLLMYAPDFAGGQIEEGDECLFLWDVTDLLRGGGEDTVLIEHTGKHLEEIVKHPIPLVIGRFQMGLIAAEATSPDVGTPPAVQSPANGTELAGPGFSAWLTAGGGLALRLGAETFPIRSRFTFPGQPRGGWNTLDPSASADGEPAWRPGVAGDGDALTVTAAGASYALTRRVRLDRHRIAVQDTFRNLTDQIVGLRFAHELDCTGHLVQDVTVGGNSSPDAPASDLSADNPTLFVRLGQSGLGLLAEDDVFRVLSRLEFRYPLGILGSDHLGLAPGATVTLEWALYPTATGDAWDFLNQVRRDWDVNFTIPAGSFWSDCTALARWSDQDLKQYLEWSGGRWVMATPWLDTYPLPTRPTYEQLVAIVRPVAEKLHRVCPDAKLFLGTHPTMNFAIPGQGFDSEAYRDSWILGADGKHFWSKTYTDYFCVGAAKEQGYLNFCNYMVPGNSYFAKMLREADVALDQAKADGIYCDEFNHYNNLSPRTYGQWDRHYVDLEDATFAVKTGNPCALLSFVTDEAQQQYVEYIQKKGGLFLANAQPVTRRMQRLHVPRFVETPSPAPAFRSALFSPLVYGNPPLPPDEAGLFQFVRDRLLCAALTHLGGMPKLTRPCVTARMFPFTPVDIRPGLLTGVERIITTQSGRYGWAAPFRGRVFVYDAAGVLAEPEPAVKTFADKAEITVPDRGIVILERVD
jgi:hypothetical protein